MNMNDFLNFRTMVTPTIIKIIFWIGVAGSVLTGFGTIIAGIAASAASARYGGGMGGGLPGGLMVLSGMLEIVLGPIFVRVWCELIILFFRIYETLMDINKNTVGGQRPSESPLPPSVGAGSYPV